MSTSLTLVSGVFVVIQSSNINDGISGEELVSKVLAGYYMWQSSLS